MRNFYLLLSFVLFASNSSGFQQQTKGDSTRTDSLTHDFQTRRKTKHSTQFSRHLNDSSLLQLSSGTTILNSLRGQVPNLSISASAQNAMAIIRNGNGELLIDGLVFDNSINNFLPLNGFDFASVTTYSNPNEMISFDGLTGGVVVLQSKSGKEVKRPTFEFNSYSTLNQFEVDGNTSNLWLFAHSASFAQDFGKVDTRLSYTLNSSLGEESLRTPLNHTINTNTGIDVSSKFSIRLLTNTNLMRYSSDSQRPNTPVSKMERNHSILNANLLLRYQFAKWLYATSRLSFSQQNLFEYFEGTNTTDRDYNNKRSTSRLFLNFDKAYGKFNLQANVGLQTISQRLNLEGHYNNSLLTYQAEFKSPSLSGGITVVYNDLLAFNGNFRESEYSSLPQNDNRKKNFSVGTSFSFSPLINWRYLSNGKIRLNYGKRTPMAFVNYPIIPTNQNITLPRVDKNIFEIGLDLAFIDDRLNITSNYFSNTDKSTSTSFLNVGNISNSGTEVILSGTPVLSPNLKHELSLIWSTSNIIILDATGNNDPNVFLPSPLPDWRSSIYNSLTLKKTTLSFLFDVSRGGSYFSPGSLVDGSFTKLRDLSIGYWFSNSIVKKLGLSKAWLSTSLRNPIVFTQSGFDSEESAEKQKTISLNFYASF